jgi:hypothetical protein
MHTREGYSMQADVILGVTIAVFAPFYGAALVILCCLGMCTALRTRNYDLIIDTYSRVLRWNNQRATIYVLTHNLHHAATHRFRAHYHLNIGKCQFVVQDDNKGLRLLRLKVKGALAWPVPPGFLQALHLLKEKNADNNQHYALPLYIRARAAMTSAVPYQKDQQREGEV